MLLFGTDASDRRQSRALYGRDASLDPESLSLSLGAGQSPVPFVTSPAFLPVVVSIGINYQLVAGIRTRHRREIEIERERDFANI